MPAPSLEKIQPYIEQLFEDSDVQKHLSRAADNFRGATSRASRAKSKQAALKDRRVHRRLLESARAAFAAGVAIKRGPEKRKRRSRRGWLLALAGLGAAGLVAGNEQARDRLLGLVGSGSSDPAAT
jgi:hypothetical protein